jgi:hypothetical protein
MRLVAASMIVSRYGLMKMRILCLAFLPLVVFGQSGANDEKADFL